MGGDRRETPRRLENGLAGLSLVTKSVDGCLDAHPPVNTARCMAIHVGMCMFAAF